MSSGVYSRAIGRPEIVVNCEGRAAASLTPFSCSDGRSTADGDPFVGCMGFHYMRGPLLAASQMLEVAAS
jgi:hypothetical protein